MGKFHRAGMVIAFLVILVCAYIGIRTIFVEDKSATVPSMVGMQLADAADVLQSAGLLAKFDRVDSPEAADTIISQSLPAGDKVSKGKVVILRVSKGGAVMPMPDVRGMKFEDGVKRLSESGFKVGNILRVTDKNNPAGSIIAQNPAAPEQVAANCMVSLLVSTGTSGKSLFVTVPDMRGQTSDMARSIIEQIGLTVGTVSDTPSISVQEGAVVSTNPRQGARVPAGSQVSIMTARAPADNETTSDTPSVGGQDKKRAEAVRTIVVQNTEPSEIPVKTQVKTTKAPEIKPEEPKPAPQNTQQPAAETKPETKPQMPQAPAPGQKTAKIRYQVPPLTKPMSLHIELTDKSGTKVLKDIMAKGSEYISINAPYTGEAKITIFLGGDFVWQDHFN